jgi:hypothetical protein
MKQTQKAILGLFLAAGCLLLLNNSCKKDKNPYVDGPAAGYAEGNYNAPAEAALEDVTTPTTVVGNGTPGSCTGQAFIDAVAGGGIIVFDCGAEPITIVLDEPAKVFNDANNRVVIDGGGLVTLSGDDKNRILYINTCDPDLHWTTSHCNDQDHPLVTLQKLTFVRGNSISDTENEGGGAIWARGGRLKVVNCRFFNNRCKESGPDVGGGTIRVFDQYQDLPVIINNCTFGGADGYGNSGANGGALSSIGVSWNIYNSLFTHNHALGNGGNPAQSGTPGGGSGGAIYNDGNTMTLGLYGCKIEDNDVTTYGAAIFFVTNDHTGNIIIDKSIIRRNQGGSWYPTYPDISAHSDTPITVSNSTIED